MKQEAKPTPTEPLHILYRPKKFADVLGNDAVITSLQKLIKERKQQAFLFAGPSGCGKTTLARICAKSLGCTSNAIRELDAATYTGVDDMRAVTAALQYEPFGNSTGRALVIDECHALSRNAWQSLLKSVEEPPKGAFWFFCTTEPGKVPDTIKTRCASYTLKSLPDDLLRKLFDKVADAEGIEYQPDVGRLIVSEAGGSPRQLLVNMAMCRDVESKKEAATILRSAIGSAGALELCRFLITGQGGWVKAMAIVGKLADESPEGVRIQVSNYFAKVAQGAKNEKQAVAALNVLEAFSTPFNQSEQMAPLVRAIGQVLYA